MSSKKKKKGGKGKAIPLSEFLNNSASAGTITVPPKGSSWGDDNDDDDRYYKRDQQKTIVLPTAPRTALGPDIDPEKIPKSPPYTAFVANLPFEVADGDIEGFFEGLDVVSIRLPTEVNKGGRFKGFGYVEFGSRADLLEALAKNNDKMNGRNIRVDVTGGDNQRRDHRGGDRGREEDVDRSGNDTNWRAGGPPESSRRNDRSPDDRNRRGFESRGDRGYDRGGDRYGDRDRGDRYGDRDRGDRYGDRDRGGRSYGGGGDRYDDRGGGGRYGGGRYDDDRRGGGFNSRRSDDEWRRGGGEREEERKERPKLQLKPRTKPLEEGKENTPQGENEQSDDPPKSNSIFGSARPVDTLTRELEIEKKIKAPSPPPVVPAPKVDIFGSAKPVDTASREREIEAKLGSKDPKSDERIISRGDRDRDDRRRGGPRNDDRSNNTRQNDRNIQDGNDQSAPKKLPTVKKDPVILDITNKFEYLDCEGDDDE